MSIGEFIFATNEFIIEVKMYSTVNIDEFSNWLQNEMDRRGWSQADLAREAGLSRGAVGNVLRQERKPGKDLLIGIAKAFNLPVEEVFRRAGVFPVATSTDPDKEELNFLYDQLPPEARREYLEMLRFRVEQEKSRKHSSRRKRPARNALEDK